MSVSTATERIFRIGGYVKRAKLNLRNEREIRAFHRNAIERRFGDFEDGTLVDVYIDITGYKETAKRPEMLRLMRDCADGKVNPFIGVIPTHGELEDELEQIYEAM